MALSGCREIIQRICALTVGLLLRGYIDPLLPVYFCLWLHFSVCRCRICFLLSTCHAFNSYTSPAVQVHCPVPCRCRINFLQSTCRAFSEPGGSDIIRCCHNYASSILCLRHCPEATPGTTCRRGTWTTLQEHVGKLTSINFLMFCFQLCLTSGIYHPSRVETFYTC